MIDKLTYIDVGEKRYPIAFTLNVMESVQEKYGSMEEWGNVLEPEKWGTSNKRYHLDIQRSS